MNCYLDHIRMAISLKKSYFVLDFVKLLFFLNCDFFEREVFSRFYLLYSTYFSEAALRELAVESILALKFIETYEGHQLALLDANQTILINYHALIIRFYSNIPNN